MPDALSAFLVTNFKVDQVKLDLINNLGYLSLSSYVSQGSCSIRDIVALAGRSYIKRKDLTVVSFIVKIMASVIHDHAQEQQNNVLLLGNSNHPVDLNKLPTDDAGLRVF